MFSAGLEPPADPKSSPGSEPSWRQLQGLFRSSQRSGAWRRVGEWALDKLSEQLGEHWPASVWAKYSRLPGGLAFASTHTVAYAELVELALRMELLRDSVRFVPLRRALQTDPREELVRHLRLQLEVGALALRDGYSSEFEPSIPGGERRGDLAIDLAGAGPAVIETRAVLPDAGAVAVSEFTDRLFPEINWIVSRHGASCHGTVSEILDRRASEELLAEIEARARLVSAGLLAPPIRFHGADLTVARAGGESAGLRGPRIGGDGWPRIASRLVEKAEQTVGASNVWLRFDVLQGLWQFSQWSQADLATKAEQLGAAVTAVLAPYKHVRGAVLSSGSLLSQGEFEDEEYVDAEAGTIALRRVIEPLRVRESILVFNPPAEPCAEQVDIWRCFYAEEPSWLDWALRAFELPSIEQVFKS